MNILQLCSGVYSDYAALYGPSVEAKFTQCTPQNCRCNYPGCKCWCQPCGGRNSCCTCVGRRSGGNFQSSPDFDALSGPSADYAALYGPSADYTALSGPSADFGGTLYGSLADYASLSSPFRF